MYICILQYIPYIDILTRTPRANIMRHNISVALGEHFAAGHLGGAAHQLQAAWNGIIREISWDDISRDIWKHYGVYGTITGIVNGPSSEFLNHRIAEEIYADHAMSGPLQFCGSTLPVGGNLLVLPLYICIYIYISYPLNKHPGKDPSF